MNAIVKPHIMQTINWSERTLEEWLTQFGFWCDARIENKRSVVESIPDRKLTEEQKEWLIAEYFNNEKYIKNISINHKNQKKNDCITDNEARAVQKLWLELNPKNNLVLRDWLWTVWDHYVNGSSYGQIATRCGISKSSVQQDIRCGLSHIAGRNSFLRFGLLGT